MKAKRKDKKSGWRNRIVKHGEVDPRKLKPNPRNWRRHEAFQARAMGGILDEIGFIQNIIVNRRTGNLVDGHLRLQLALDRKEKKIPVVYVDLSRAEEAKALATLDPIAAMATADGEKLQSLLSELKIEDGALQQMLSNLAKEVGIDGVKQGLCDPDDVPESPEEPTTEKGDIWVLGEHRVMCGDSTDAGYMARLMDRKKAIMCFTDPPWNVGIGLDSNPRHRQRNGLANDNLEDEVFIDFLNATAAQIAKVLKGDLYCVLGAKHWPQLDMAVRQAGFHWSASIIWVKDLFVLGRSKYHRRYEPIWYGWHNSAESSYCADRRQDDVWEIQRPRVSEEHPTMKPIALVEQTINNSSHPNDMILDPFLGSGTTIIAAERLNRHCYGMEIEPLYVDVAVKRWQNFTGKKAVLKKGGRTFDKISEARQ